MVNKKHYYDWHTEEVNFLDFFESFLDKKPVLDIACGTGWLGKYNKYMYGIDNDEGAIKIASKLQKAQLGNVSKKLPYKSSFFQGVIAKDIIEHLPDNITFIKEIHRVLKPKGLVFIGTKLPIEDFWSDYTHIRPYNKQSLKTLLEDHGFKVLELWYSGNWPGLGILMRLFKINKTPRFFFFLTKLGLNRNCIDVIAEKI